MARGFGRADRGGLLRGLWYAFSGRLLDRRDRGDLGGRLLAREDLGGDELGGYELVRENRGDRLQVFRDVGRGEDWTQRMTREANVEPIAVSEVYRFEAVGAESDLGGEIGVHGSRGVLTHNWGFMYKSLQHPCVDSTQERCDKPRCDPTIKPSVAPLSKRDHMAAGNQSGCNLSQNV